MPIKLSVVIPTYKRPALLQVCLQAIIHQTIDANDFEVLVVSDGFDAATKEVVQKISCTASFVKYLHLPEKKGPAAARNLGWQQAQGGLIVFTDDDCVPEKDWLSGFWEAYKGEQKIAFTGKIKVPISLPPSDYEKNTAGLETAAFVTANCCCTKAALQEVGGFDERFSMAWREDSDLEFKLLLHHIPIVRSVNAQVVHPVRKAPWGISIKEQKKGLFNALLYKKYPQLYRQNINAKPGWNYYLMVLSIILLLIGIIVQWKALSLVAFFFWIILVALFVRKRLATTNHSISHVSEMIITSLVIPFASVYWHFYGAWKYKALFI